MALKPHGRIYNDITETIGGTPLVRLNRIIPKGGATVVVKCEFFNPLSSVKDRIGLAMIEAGEASGKITRETVIIEPTSGNTGIALAFVCAARGYKLILTMPAQMSEERKRTLRAYGAQLVLTDPTRRMQAAIEEAEKIALETGAWMPNQFGNPANPAAHYTTTGPEIWSQLEGRIDAFVFGSGTGGTLTGTGRYLLEQNPEVKIVAVEPARSNVISGGERGEHGFQGMGPGFIPPNLDVNLLDEVLQIWEEDAYPFARALAQHEGLFVGMSSGGIIYAANKVARALGPGKRVATIACDTGARYLTTALFSGEADTPPGYLVRSRERVGV